MDDSLVQVDFSISLSLAVPVFLEASLIESPVKSIFTHKRLILSHNSKLVPNFEIID